MATLKDLQSLVFESTHDLARPYTIEYTSNEGEMSKIECGYSTPLCHALSFASGGLNAVVRDAEGVLVCDGVSAVDALLDHLSEFELTEPELQAVLAFVEYEEAGCEARL